jgi:hypothetical protein
MSPPITTKSKKKKGFQSMSSLFSSYHVDDAGGYITREFQDYGYRIAAELNDLKHKSLYIKLAKDVDRRILESARSFVVDAHHARSKAKLFMWKVKQLREEKEKRKSEKK